MLISIQTTIFFLNILAVFGLSLSLACGIKASSVTMSASGTGKGKLLYFDAKGAGRLHVLGTYSFARITLLIGEMSRILLSVGRMEFEDVRW